MDQVSIVGLDLAKRVFQVHGAGADGRVLFRKRPSRGQLLPFFANLSHASFNGGARRRVRIPAGARRRRR